MIEKSMDVDRVKRALYVDEGGNEKLFIIERIEDITNER